MASLSPRCDGSSARETSGPSNASEAASPRATRTGADEHDGVGEIVEQAIRHGIPFPDLRAETHLHALAASALAGDDQDWLVTDASHYHASALEDGLWRRFGRLARPEVKGFLRGLVEGVPLFGQEPADDGTAYAAIGLEKLRFFRKGLEDLREQVAYRVGRKGSPSEGDREAAEFIGEFCGWVDQVVEAERDLWSQFG